MAAVTCPHCQVKFPDSLIRSTQALGQSADGIWQAQARSCPECGRTIVDLLQYAARQGPGGSWRTIRVYPRVSGRPPAPPEVPSGYGRYYDQAALILLDSPMASAALSRRWLQDVIENVAGIKKPDLAKEIQALLDSKTLPSYLAEQIDGVRNIGNFGAHPIKSQVSAQVLDVEPGEAEWNLDTLEMLFDFYFVGPAKAQQRRDALNAKLAEAGKPPMK